MSSARIPTLPELLETPQYAGRGMFRAGWRRQAGQPGAGVPDALAAPRAGAGAGAGRPRPVPDARASSAAARFPPRPSPIACRSRDLRVLDFTQAWAGPMTARALAFLGAEVIKIENGARLDSWRGPAVGVNDPASYPDRQGGERPYDRNALFNTQNHDKTVDLAST